MVGPEVEQLMHLLATYAVHYGDAVDPNMTVRELADDLMTSHSQFEPMFQTDYNHVKSVFV